MLFRLIIQSWRHNLRSKTLAMATVFLAAALISALLAVSINSGDKMSREMKSYGANILVEPAIQAVLPELLGDAAHAPRNTSDYIDESELLNIKEIFWRNNILGFAPLLSGEARLVAISGLPRGADFFRQTPATLPLRSDVARASLPVNVASPHATPHVAPSASSPVPILGTFFDKALPLPDDLAFRTGQRDIALYWNIHGEWPDDDAPQALAGSRLAAARGWTPGTRLTLALAPAAEAAHTPLQTT
ncbi:MAG: hypothetical protein LBK99_07200, partial [Opitutaceae bacterium]|nr:hypothetical protein [Opitutaceae bacterium]